MTSGAEDWILHGHRSNSSDSSGTSTTIDGISTEPSTSKPGDRFDDSGRHFIDSGPSWRSKVPPFRVLVHSPYKHTSLSNAYTMYQVTSIFPHSSHSPKDPSTSSQPDTDASGLKSITVHRRFSHFVTLHTTLTRKLPGLALPPLPGKQYAGRFNDAFVEARRGDLERYLARLVRHPVARYVEQLMFFLGCENDAVSATNHHITPWEKLMKPEGVEEIQ